MGAKIGQFTSRSGHAYEVRLTGNTVADGNIDLGIPPATISMSAGAHKFCGYKSTTAAVNILTDVPLIELYSAGVTDIRLTITDITDNNVEFDGYVVPFAFDQPYTGTADVVTVNAVDLLTARKSVKYSKIGNTFAIDEYAHDIVGEIAHRAGITEIVINLNFNGTADAMYTDSPLNVLVAQAGFLQDEVSEVDALSDICKFFGYTACVVGRTLYLYDEHCLVNAPEGKRYNANVYRRNEAGKWTVYKHYYNQGSPIIDQSIATADIHNDISVTIERAYDGVKITPEGREVSVLLPDVCADGSYTDDAVSVGLTDENYFDSILEEGNRQNVTRRALKSKYLDTTRFAGAGDWMQPNSSANNWENGSILEDVIERSISYDTDGAPKSDSTSRHAVLWLRMNNPGAGVTLFTQSGEQYSHRGGYVRLTASAYGGTYNKPGSTDGKSFLPWLQLYAGGFIGRKTGFPSDLGHQVTTAGNYVASPFIGLQGGGVYPSSEASSKGKTGYIVETGTVNAPIYVAGHRKSGWSYSLPTEVFLRELSVEAVGDTINPDELQHIYADGEEIMEVSSRLTSRKSGYTRNKYLPDGTIAYGVNARPSVVADTSWKGGYMGRSDSESIPISGIIMEQLKARYAQPRICYKMTVEGNINPFAAVYFGGRGYTVEAYERDVYNDTTNITIN
jgi:hypothetical protein